MLGKHQTQLESISRHLDSIGTTVTGVAAQTQQIQLTLSQGPQPAAPPAREPRLPPPETYSGDPGSCQSFLTQCGLVFALQPSSFPTDRAKVAYIITLLSGRARDWGTAIWSNNAAIQGDLSLFSTEMKKVFDRSKQGREAAREVLQLRQRSQSVSDYSIQFRTLASTSGWNQEAFYDVFLNGLSEEIKDHLIPHELPQTFDGLVDMAIRVDVRLGQRRQMRAPLTFPRQESQASLLTPGANPDPPDTSEPMQVDRTRLTPAERRRRLLAKACLYCGQVGHFVDACPVKDNARQK